LVAEGFHQHVPKGYIYFSIFFSIIVETLNIRMLKAKDKPVDLHDEYVDSSAGQQ
jgi:predicted tellurium resistance membrane protein TerC